MLHSNLIYTYISNVATMSTLVPTFTQTHATLFSLENNIYLTAV